MDFFLIMFQLLLCLIWKGKQMRPILGKLILYSNYELIDVTLS